MARVTNWAGNHAFRGRIHEPASVDQLREIVSKAPKIHALGSRHSFHDIADADELVSLDGLPEEVAVDRERRTVTVNAGIRYGTLARALEREGFALHNMASLPHISVGGAVATATHGSGDGCGNLATAVAGVELVTSDGEVHHFERGDADFPGVVVHLGALGVVTRLTLDIEPSYLMRQQVFEHLAWDHVLDRFEEFTASAYSVSLFASYGDDIEEVWLKSRVESATPAPPLTEFFGVPVATVNLHPVPALSAENCTVQLGEVGAWADRLPHFRVDSVPASGNELQSEYMVAREHAVEAIRAIRAIAHVFRGQIWTAEIRTATADDLWLSTAYGRDTVCLHFSWHSDPAAVERFLPEVEAALASFEPRPHWGKIFRIPWSEIAPRYPRLADFRALAARLDPRGAFRNDFLERTIFTEQR